MDTLDMKALGFSKAETRVTGRKPGYPGNLLTPYTCGYLNQIRSSRWLKKRMPPQSGIALATEVPGTGCQANHAAASLFPCERHQLPVSCDVAVGAPGGFEDDMRDYNDIIFGMREAGAAFMTGVSIQV